MTSTTGTTGTPGIAGSACPHCGWPDAAEPFQVVSRHATAAGRTVWTRCGCGSLQIRVIDDRGMRIVSRSGPAVPQSSPASR